MNNSVHISAGQRNKELFTSNALLIILYCWAKKQENVCYGVTSICHAWLELAIISYLNGHG